MHACQQQNASSAAFIPLATHKINTHRQLWIHVHFMLLLDATHMKIWCYSGSDKLNTWTCWHIIHVQHKRRTHQFIPLTCISYAFWAQSLHVTHLTIHAWACAYTASCTLMASTTFATKLAHKNWKTRSQFSLLFSGSSHYRAPLQVPIVAFWNPTVKLHNSQQRRMMPTPLHVLSPREQAKNLNEASQPHVPVSEPFWWGLSISSFD